MNKIFHNFFYQNKPTAKAGNLSYNANVFKSYAAIIGVRLVSEKTKDTITIVSDYKYTVTTAKHIHQLRCASPDTCIVYADLRNIYPYGDVSNACFANTICNSMIKKFESPAFNLLRLSVAANRETTKDMCNSILTLNLHFPKRFTRKFINAVKKRLEEASNPDLYKRKVSPETKAKNQVVKQCRDKILTYMDSLDLHAVDKVQLLHLNARFKKYFTESDKLYAMLYKLNSSAVACASRGYSYTHPNCAETVKTTQGITLSRTEFKLLYKLWKANRLLGVTVSDTYIVTSVTESSIAVGCHLIPVENIEDTYKFINCTQSSDEDRKSALDKHTKDLATVVEAINKEYNPLLKEYTKKYKEDAKVKSKKKETKND